MYDRYSTQNGDNICIGAYYKGERKLYQYRCSNGSWKFIKNVAKGLSSCSANGTLTMQADTTEKIAEQVHTMQTDPLCSPKTSRELPKNYYKRLSDCDKKYYRFSYNK